MLLALSVTAYAQMPQAVQMQGKTGQFSLEKMACADQYAGTIEFGTFTGESNDIDEATPIFLCINDTYQILHNGDEDLTGDPQPSTDPGITYAFYSGMPTVGGPDLTTILTDPNLIPNPTPGPDGAPFFVTGSTGDINGDILLENTGALQTFFNGGNPVQLWFAPITIDNFAANGYEDDPDTGESGPCVNANVNEAFSVVFLTELTASNQSVDGLCEGSFNINGGLPQFDGSDYTDISIELVGDPSVTGTVTSAPASAGDAVTFEVTQGGTYEITVRDDKNCPTVFTMTFPTADPLELEASTATVPPGSPVCIEITTADFENIVSLQTTINYDESILMFTGFQNVNVNLPTLDASIADNGSAILVSWFDPAAAGITLADNALLFEICFDVIGTGGDVSPVAFDESVLADEVTNPCGEIGTDTTDGSVTVTLEAFGVDVDVMNESCTDSEDGSFTVTVSGGQAPFTVTWVGVNSGDTGGPVLINTDGGDFTTPSNLAPDDYDITVTDNLGSVVEVTVTVEEGSGFAVNTTYTSPTCFSDCDGEITAQLFSDTGPITPGNDYTFLWNTGDMTQTITGLCSATSPTSYSVTVTGPNSCTGEASEVVFDPGEIMPNANVTDATCSGAGDGQIMLSITGGAGGYMVDWANPTIPDNSTNVSGLNDDIYELEITDANMCSQTFLIEVGAEKILTLDETINELDCFGDCDGSISVVASTSGGTSASYMFTWIGNPPPGTPTNTANTSEINNLCAGIYQVFLTDEDNCSVNETYILGEPQELIVTEINTTAVTCNGAGNDGTATIGVTGGTSPYMYAWGVAGQTDSTAVNLAAGVYEVTVTDANSCSGTLEVTIDAPIPPMITELEDDNVPCSGSVNGMLTVETADGGAPVTGVEWSTGETTNTISDLVPGEYYVTVTAADGCTTVDTALVIAPQPLTLADLQIEPTNCPGQGSGFISLILEGGTGPFSFNWVFPDGSTGPDQPTLTGDDIVTGTYNVTVTEGLGCPGTLEVSAFVPEPPGITATFDMIEPVSCFNYNGVPADGQATVTPFYEDDPGNTQGQTWNITWFDSPDSPGETAEIYLQENGVLTSTADNLERDEQFVIISDGQCFDTVSVNIPAPPPITATATTIGVSCFGDTDGSVTITGEGGTGDFSYIWSTGDTDVTTVEDLPPGEVSVTLIDENGCNFGFITEVNEPAEFEVFSLLETRDSVSCFEGDDALLSVGTTGGNEGPLTYEWEDDIAEENESIATDVGPGSWSVTVTDVKGCTDDFTFLVTQPDPITFEFSFDTIQCFGQEAEFRIDTVIGGTADDYIDYTYRLNINPINISVNTPLDITAGQYTVSVFDANECEVVDSFTLTQPNELIVDLPETLEIELGDTMTQLFPTVINDFPLDSIIWTPMNGSLSNDTILNPFILNSVDDQVYKLTLTDVNGCMGMDEVRVEIDRNRNIFIPNVFSPNNDGYNDEFGVFGCLGVSLIRSGQVYDRWGGLVASVPIGGLAPECISPNGTVVWDGTFRGKPVDNGVYVYYIEVEFLDGTVLIYRGDVTVLR